MSDLIFHFNPTGQLYSSPRNNDLDLYSLSITQSEDLIFQSDPTPKGAVYTSCGEISLV